MKSAKVYFQEDLAGILAEEPSGEISFRYEKSYLENTKMPPISIGLPKREEPYLTAGLPPFFDGLIPEGWLLTLAADKFQLNPYRDRFALLLATCQDTIGAVSITESLNEKKVLPKSWDHKDYESRLLEISQRFDRCLYCYKTLDKKLNHFYHTKCSLEIFKTESPPILDFDEENIRELGMETINKKLSVPGVQKKISLSLDLNHRGTKSYRMTVSNLWARYILKPRGFAPHLPENEHLNLLMARHAGIKTANSGLLPLLDGQLAFISERFDRYETSRKFHVEDFCQLLEKRPEQKYIGSIEQVGKKLRQVTFANAPEDNILRLFELVVFCFLTGNADLHLKNLSILWAPDPSLSPAYDLLCTEAWIKNDEETALSIVGKKNKLLKMDFEKLAAHLGIKTKVFNHTFSHLSKQVSPWLQLIDQSYLDREHKELFTEVLQSRAKRLFS